MKQISSKLLRGLCLFFLLCATLTTVSAQQRRPIDAQHPLWFIHVDVWYKADPQKIIDLIPEDIRPYVCMNLSLSCGYDKARERYKMPHYAFQTYKSWGTVCQKNGVWFSCQPASGGHTHIQDYDMATFEYFFKKFPNFLGWNYAEQFWGFDESGDKSSATQTDRWALFARLVEMSHQYGGVLTVSFCGNIWSHGLNPIGELKRNSKFLQACKNYPENMLFLYKYTTSSCFYNNESVSWGPFISGLTRAYGVRYDNCGWNGAMDDIMGEGKCVYPAAAGIGTVMEQTCVNGGSVWDGPELTWNRECMYESSQTTVDNNYRRRNWARFANMNGVWIDMFRKIVDGTMYIPTREEVVGKTQIVIINDKTSGDDEDKYATWGSLYDGLYKQTDPMNRGNGQWMNNYCYFKSTGRYGAIPMVTGLYDDAAKAIPLQVKKSNYTSRWSTETKKLSDFQTRYPKVSTGDLYVNRYRNQLVTYNPHSYLNGKQRAEAVMPLEYNTCDEMELRYGKLSSGLIREYADHIDFYLNNYRAGTWSYAGRNYNDTVSMALDTIIIRGCSAEPVLKLTKHSSAKNYSSTTATQRYGADTGIDTIIVRHCGGLDLTVSCSGSADRSDKTDAIELKPLELPKQPEAWRGEILIEAEDMDFKNVKNCCTDQYGQYPSVIGHAGNGFVDMGTNSGASLRHQLELDANQAGDYVISVRYTCTSKAGNVKITVNGTTSTVSCAKTNTNEWRYARVEATMNEGTNELVIQNSGSLPMYIDQVSYRPKDVAPMTYYVSLQDNEGGVITADKEEAAEGDTITLDIEAAKGFELTELRLVNSVFYTLGKTLSLENGGLFPASDAQRLTPGTQRLCFVMPNDNVTLKPVYAEKGVLYKLNFETVVAGTMPPGWRCVQENGDVHEYPNSYSQGARTMNGFNGHQGKAIYWRDGVAEYGRQNAFPLTLEPGDYVLDYSMAAWKNSPKYKAQILDYATGEVIATSASTTATPNANGSTSASVTSAKLFELPFTVDAAGRYVISFQNQDAIGGFDEFLLLECSLKAVEPEFIEGDVNGDGVVDVADISTIISVMAGATIPEASGNADVNGDGSVDVADISNVISIMAANARTTP